MISVAHPCVIAVARPAPAARTLASMMKTLVGVDPRAAFWLPPIEGLHRLVRIEIHLMRKVAQSISRKLLFSLWASAIAALQQIHLNIGASKPSVQTTGIGQAARKG
ncbi:hypothetical protein [Paraburkholderia sp. HD33-4]|uniref:hypothetical protein n=1 Tax=Paraburkholderia sp. HD33-4 TaxID=2883242 RepID=UPI001F3DB483|nr:hypothetical protein [Paraburkholderia sp. HD33-4]